jgi:putative ABC transport system permease protein
MADISARLADEHPGPNGAIRATVSRLRDAQTGGSRAGLLALLGAVGALLLIGCLNAASLQTARVATRAREFAVRAAVGASRRRLARQLLIEGLVLALLSGLAGLAIAHALIRSTIALDPGGIPRLADAAIDLRVLPLALALSTVVGVVFGLLPLGASRRTALASVLHEGGRSATASRRWLRLRAGLVVVQIALSLALVTGSALMVQTVVRLGRVDPGFDPDGLLAVTVQLTTTGTPQDGWRQTFRFYRDLTQRVTALPGVSSAAVMTPLPLTGANRQNRYWLAGMTATTVAELPRIDTAVVSERYFETMRIPLLSGRAFDTTDIGPRSVAIVDETFAARYFPGRDPVGQEVVMGLPGPNAPRLRIVGLAGAVHQYRLTQEPLPQIYLTQRQWPLGGWFLVRTTDEAAAIAPAVRAAIHDVDPAVPVLNTYPATELLRESTASETFSAFVLTLFAVLALGLAGLGLSGLMAHEVASRRREIGIRLALGATARDVRRQVVGRAMTLVAAGSMIGLGASWVLARALDSLAFGVSAADPVTYGVAMAVLSVAGLAGALLPSVRASRVSAVEVLG